MNEYSDWIGRQSEAQDLVTRRLVGEFRATVDLALCNSGDLPGLQWCLAPDIYRPADLGRDGHPKKGLTLPDLGLPRRMWAGGRIVYHAGLNEGETVTRISTIRDIAFKNGKSGRLGFVTVEHHYSCGDELRIEEQQNIVYREDPAPGSAPSSSPPAEPWSPVRALELETSPTLLFRYSAATFNGHRIHYDFPYATNVEGYSGLVVHGPLQSTWLQHLAAGLLGKLPAEFFYRSVSPLICGRTATIEVRENGDALDLRVRDAESDIVTMTGSAR